MAQPVASKILLDAPCAQPALGFQNIATALATIIAESEPQFAVGVFGGWGSGKTTLMRAIRARLAPRPSLVLVDFNAWRFEREPLLLVPLLDTIRASLVAWSEQRGAETREKVRAVAVRIGRVVRALATGLSGEVGIPGAVKVRYDVGKALDGLGPSGEPGTAQSLYVAAFTELSAAFSQFESGGVTRVVVFVDDLDRCLPANALDVLESMKLFFDLPGFVFVVGLDEDVVERAVLSRFVVGDGVGAEADPQPNGNGSRVAGVAERLSRDYVKKMFQVPYGLPPMVPQQLDALLAAMYQEAVLGSTQLEDLKKRVHPHLGYVAVERRINPREVKRFINAYTLQTLIRDDLDRDTLLAVQTLAFRYEWELLYDVLLADSSLFVDALRRYRNGEEHALEDLSPDLANLPADLAGYLRSACAEPLTRHASLDTYLSSLQAHTEPHNTWLLGAYRPVGKMRREARRVQAAARLGQREADGLAKIVATESASLPSLFGQGAGKEAGPRLLQRVEKLQTLGRELTAGSGGPSDEAVLRPLVNDLNDELERLYRDLQALRSF
jgi:hypothetical protein